MKRLALALALVLAAAALLGTGCGDNHTCSRSVTLDWTSGFTTADGAVASCSTAPAIQRIDVFVNDGFAGSLDCSAGRGTVAVPGGSNDLVTVEAIDAADAIIYRDEFRLDSSTCGNQTVPTQPAEGWVDVAYAFSPVNACFSPGPSFIWVKVRDDIAGRLAADSALAPTQFTCGDPVSFRLASGSYTLLETREMISIGAGTFGTVAKDCVDRALTVSAAATTPVSVVLTDSTTSCP